MNDTYEIDLDEACKLIQALLDKSQHLTRTKVLPVPRRTMGEAALLMTQAAETIRQMGSALLMLTRLPQTKEARTNDGDSEDNPQGGD